MLGHPVLLLGAAETKPEEMGPNRLVFWPPTNHCFFQPRSKDQPGKPDRRYEQSGALTPILSTGKNVSCWGSGLRFAHKRTSANSISVQKEKAA
jgi:hypothetical protein